jgi:hypothetical protein
MDSAIFGILTDNSLRSDQAVEEGLISQAEAGLAWGPGRLMEYSALE